MSALINSLKKALDVDPSDWETRSTLVDALAAEGHADEAKSVVEAGGDPPDEGPGHEHAQKAYAASGMEFPELAVAVLVEEDEPEEEVEEPKAYVRSIVPPGEAPSEATVAVSIADEEEGPEIASDVDFDREVPPVLEANPDVQKDGEGRAFYVIETTAEELEELHHVEEISEKKHDRTIKRDRFNSLTLTIALHIALFFALAFVATHVPSNNPPNVVASASAATEDDIIDPTELNKPVPRQTPAAAAFTPNIVSVEAFSAVSINNVDVQTPQALDMGVTFSPSMNLGMSSGMSMQLFGEKIIEKGEKLGVVLDVSGSMAEFLPRVIREIDRNFDNTPIVYVNNALIRNTGNQETEIRRIVEEEVVPYYEDRTHTPYWFLWHDLPRKAPQPAVDRLMEYFKKRPNAFIAVGGYNRMTAAADFLAKQKVDAIYIFSDFEDFVDEELARDLGQRLGTGGIKTFVQPAQQKTEFLKIMAQKVANRSKGRELKPLNEIQVEEDTSIMAALEDNTVKPEDIVEKLDVRYATPRAEVVGDEFYAFRPNQNWFEIARLEEPEYEVVFYGPEARGELFLKNEKGEFMQYPITFGYHSWKYVEDPTRNNELRPRRRKFLRLAEDPTFDGKEIVWKMILEDELEFDVHLYLGRKGMNATYVADPPKDETSDNAYIYFRVPPLVREREDRYYGYDLPPDGLNLDQVREYAQFNTMVLNLPNGDRDRFEKHWGELGFEAGYNTRHFHELIRHLPNGIRDMVVEGPSFGPRKFHARTTSNRILLRGRHYRADIELWESFNMSLVRPADRRTRFTKTEAIEIQIE